MRKERTIEQLGRVQVEENEYGGCMYVIGETIGDQILGIKVQQQDGEYIRKAWRTGNLEQMYILNFQPNQYITGKIVIEESYDPPNIEDPEAFLLWDNGEVVRVDAQAVYHVEYHSIDMRVEDTILAE